MAQAMKEALQGSKYKGIREDLQPAFRQEYVKVTPAPKFSSDMKI